MAENRKSVGVVLFRDAQADAGKAKEAAAEKKETHGNREYLLLHYAAGHWDFPKGGQEAGETDEQTLKRELVEETSITHVELVPGFTHELSYFFREQGKLIRKTVVFYVGKAAADAKVTLSFEHQDYTWLPYDEAKEKLTHKNAKELLEKASVYLSSR
ncbi:NUDIX domain-containing protein [Candidatus Micrarchaeota archaeon]|nr:NUDIX domain-containing protein [Candidatus Micrarchaeota archaeon]